MKSQTETATCKEVVLFNSDTLSKTISYLPSIDVLSLAITSKRFSISDNNELSLIEESARIAIKDIATEEQLSALPRYDGESSLADYHYLQLLREPLTFDRLDGAEYVNSGDKSCITSRQDDYDWDTAFSNNIMRKGKHYVSFEVSSSSKSYIYIMLGVMRPGKANQNARGYPLYKQFYQNFSPSIGHGENNNKVQCCMYHSADGECWISDWDDPGVSITDWDGMEVMSYGGTIGMLLDLDEGTLSVYINGRKLGIMKRGLAGPYCWVVSLYAGTQVTIRRGKIPKG